MQTVGTSPLRKEGVEKLTGQATYVDDIRLPGMLYGVTVRSSVPRGKILNIHFEGDLPWDEFVVVTAQDCPGPNSVAMIHDDQPFLADKEIHHPEEPVVLLAHEDRYLLEKARQNVRIEVEKFPSVLSIAESIFQKEIIWGKDNVLHSILIAKGDVEKAFKGEGRLLEGEYRTGAQEQLYIENNGMIAIASPEEGVTIWGSMQCPYYIHKAMKQLFKVPVRVVQTTTGGGFGGKEEYPSLLAGHAALLAWKSGKPVKIIYDRAEDLAATTKRHPSRTKLKSLVDAEGRLQALDIDFVLDGGAYATLSSVVLSRGAIHAAGPYECPNVRIKATAVATNTPPQGAFRGFGAPQSTFAMERHMDRIANQLGLEPEEFRRRNFLKKGSLTATQQEIRESIQLDALMERAFEKSHYYEKKEKFRRSNSSQSGKKRKGIGFATFLHGAGFTGSGEKNLKSKVKVGVSSSGKVTVYASSTEIGQGTNTVFAQIVADALGVSFDRIEIYQPDTSKVPDSGPTVASRTVMVVGKLIESAAVSIRQQLIQSKLLGEGYSESDFEKACARYVQKFGKLEGDSQYSQPKSIQWDEKLYRGDAYATYAWGCYVAEVEVDLSTYEVSVSDFWAHQEVGKVVHPLFAEGQIEGGVAQGIGYGLFEKVVWREGRMINDRMTNYIMGTTMDIPRIHVSFEELPSPYGPQGAKGIGELPLDGSAPAVVNAVSFALQKDFNQIPLTHEDLMRELGEGAQSKDGVPA